MEAKIKNCKCPMRYIQKNHALKSKLNQLFKFQLYKYDLFVFLNESYLKSAGF